MMDFAGEIEWKLCMFLMNKGGRLIDDKMRIEIVVNVIDFGYIEIILMMDKEDHLFKLFMYMIPRSSDDFGIEWIFSGEIVVSRKSETIDLTHQRCLGQMKGKRSDDLAALGADLLRDLSWKIMTSRHKIEKGAFTPLKMHTKIGAELKIDIREMDSMELGGERGNFDKGLVDEIGLDIVIEIVSLIRRGFVIELGEMLDGERIGVEGSEDRASLTIEIGHGHSFWME